MRPFFNFVNGSFFGHVVFYELIGSLPVFIWFLVENHNEGTLTVPFAAQFALEAIAGGSLRPLRCGTRSPRRC